MLLEQGTPWLAEAQILANTYPQERAHCSTCGKPMGAAATGLVSANLMLTVNWVPGTVYLRKSEVQSKCSAVGAGRESRWHVIHGGAVTHLLSSSTIACCAARRLTKSYKRGTNMQSDALRVEKLRAKLPAHFDEGAALEIWHSWFVLDRDELLSVSPCKHLLQHFNGGIRWKVADE